MFLSCSSALVKQVRQLDADCKAHKCSAVGLFSRALQSSPSPVSTQGCDNCKKSFCAADGDPLTWHELVADLPQQYQITALQPNAKWTFIAHVEHPHLFVPWYMLHPCQSSELLKLMLEPTAAMTNDMNTAWSDHALSRYMAAWFTLVGQVFKLKLKIN